MICLFWSATADAQSKTLRLSVPVTGTESQVFDNGFSGLWLSADGTTAVFVGGRASLVPGDSNDDSVSFGADVFIRDIPTGVTRRILGVGGAQPNGDASEAVVTRDGRYAFFLSTASNLVPHDPNGAFLSPFRHDLVTGTTTVLDIPVSSFRISGNGRYLAYAFGGHKVVDLNTNITTDLLSGGALANDVRLNHDGSLVAFYSSHVPDIFVGATWQVFVQNRNTGVTELISRRPDGLPGNGSSGSGIAISDDGRYVVFESAASDLVPNDTNGVSDVFVHDRATQQTTRVSLTTSGTERTGASGEPAISADGTVIGFSSRLPPACPDCPETGEVAIYDRNLPGVQIVSVATDGTPNTLTGYGYSHIAMDYSGRYVAFGSYASNLAPGDTNRAHDVFLRDRGPTPACTFQISPTLIDVAASGGTATVTIITTPGCGWAATVADPWVASSLPFGSGPATVSITAAPNPGISRFGYLSFEGRRILLRQPGVLASTPPQFEKVDIAPDGSAFGRGSGVAAISGDGRYVAFTGSIGSSPSGDISRVYLRDRSTGQTVDVSRAPGGPLDDPTASHAFPGIHSPEFMVRLVAGAILSIDGRYVIFTKLYSIPGDAECFLYDRDTGTSSQLPTALGNGGFGCPSMSASGRFFAGIGGGLGVPTQTVALFDRTTRHTATFQFPGIPSQDTLSAVIPSISGRYLLGRVTAYPCNVFSCAEDDYVILFDRQTGLTARTDTVKRFNGALHVRMRQQLVAPVWSEFGLNRYSSRNDQSLAACELLDHQTGQVQPLPLLSTFSPGGVDCGIAVNNGQQVVFGSAADLSPGDVYESLDMHLYTIATGAASRLSTRANGDADQTSASAVSQNGRYLLAQTITGSYYGAPNTIVGWAVLDLGVQSTVDGTVPTNLQATVSGANVALTWIAPTQGTPTSYVVEGGSSPGLSNLAVYDTGSTATALNAVAGPGTYYVRVRARSGSVTGGASNEVIVNVGGGCVSPAAPLGLAHSVTGAAVTLTWQAAAAATQYVIEAGSGPGLSNLASFDTGSSATVLSAMAGPGTYYVRIRARNSCGTSAPSNETVVVIGCQTPSAPGTLTVNLNGTTVSLVWGPAAGSVGGYVLEVGSTPGASDLWQLDVGASTGLAGIAPAGTYYVRVRAKNACGSGSASNEVVVAVP